MSKPLDNIWSLTFKSFSEFYNRIIPVFLYQRAEAVARRGSVKKYSSKFGKIHRKTLVRESTFLIKLDALACNFIKKETLAQLFYCEFSEISENAFSYRTPPLAASEREIFRQRV